MADRRVLSTATGSPTSGNTWDEAFPSLAAVAAIDAAGDRLLVSDNHAESTAAGLVLSFAGTPASPTQILCVDDSAESPTALATTGTVTTTGGSNINVDGSLYCYGITFNVGTGANSNSIILGSSSTGSIQEYEQCSFRVVNTGGSGRVIVSLNTGTWVVWKNCTVRFAQADQHIAAAGGLFRWLGGSIVSGGTTPTNLLFGSTNAGASVFEVDGVDFSNFGSTFNLFQVSTTNPARGFVRNCRLPASWTGSLVNSALMHPGSRYEMRNCDSQDTNYRLWIEDYAGSIKSETTIVRSGGASDGATPISYKMASGANAEYPMVPLRTMEIAIWNDVVGSPVTFEIEIAMNDGSPPLTDGQIYLQVQSLGPTGSPSQRLPSIFTNDAKADVLAGSSVQTMSDAVWNNLGSPAVTQKLSVTVTPQSAGYLVGTVCLVDPNRVVYVCPKPRIS